MANKMMNHAYQNFAKLIKEENEGRYMNSQMTFFYYQADEIFSEIIGNDPDWVWDELDMEEIAKIEASQLESDYEELFIRNENTFIKFNF